MSDTNTTDSTDTEQIAFGADQFKGCECPAYAAGYENTIAEHIGRLTAEFDRLAKQENLDASEDAAGIIDEARAQRLWFEAMKNLRERPIDVPEKVFEVGRDVAMQLGWTDDD